MPSACRSAWPPFVLLLGCSQPDSQPNSPRLVTASGTVKPAGSAELTVGEKAIDVLAAKLDVPRESIQLDTVRPVEWRNSSMGCPQPGEAYLQVITPGHKITLRVDGRLHFVHEAKGHAFVCRSQKAVAGVTTQRNLVWGKMAVVARKDLANRLGAEETEVRIAGARGETWSDSSLGCPEPGQTYEPGTVKGWALQLRHAGRDYTYHTDLHRVFACPAIGRE